MKRIWNIFIVLIFMLIIYDYAKTVKIYQAENIKDKAESCEKEVEQNITSVRFEHGVTQEDIMKIAELKNLEYLEISFSDAVSEDDIDLSLLGNLTELQELTIYFYTDQDNIDFSFIKDLHNLRSIFIDRRTNGLDLSLFEELVYLQGLYIEYMDDVDLNYLRKCKGLREVHIVGEHIKNLEGIAELTHLESLYLCDNASDTNPNNRIPLDLHALSDLPKLQTLYLVRVGVTDVTPLSDLPNLGYLVLSDTGVDDVESLRNLKNLYNLEIFGNRSEKVKEQVEMYMSHVETVTVTEDILYGF